RTHRTWPSGPQMAAAWRPPVCSNTRWASRTRPGIAVRTPAATARPSPARVGQSTVTGSIDAFPQPPHDEEVTASRWGGGGGPARPVERRVGDGHAGPQVDGEHVELLGLTLGSAEAHRLDVVGAGDQPFADAVPDGELEVVAGGAHGHPDRPPRNPQSKRPLHAQPAAGPPGRPPPPPPCRPPLALPSGPTFSPRPSATPRPAIAASRAPRSPSRSSLRAPP